jgi:hypothetical protein
MKHFYVQTLFLLLSMLGLLSACSADEGAQMTPALPYSLECVLETQERYAIGEPVELRFSLHNRTDRTLHVLTWYTPLEGLAGEILRLTRDENPVPYLGILAKRATDWDRGTWWQALAVRSLLLWLC